MAAMPRASAGEAAARRGSTTAKRTRPSWAAIQHQNSILSGHAKARCAKRRRGRARGSPRRPPRQRHDRAPRDWHRPGTVCSKIRSPRRNRQARPGHECGRREDRPVVGGKDRGQEDGEQSGDPKQHAVEQRAVLLLGLIDFGVPKHQPGHLPRAHLGSEGDGLPRIEIRRNISARSLFMRSGLKPNDGVMAAMRAASSSGESTRELASV